MRFIPIILDPEERDDHLASHAEEIAKGLPCACADVETTDSGLVIVTESEPVAEERKAQEDFLRLMGLYPPQDEQEDGYDLGGPYL